MVSAQPTVSVTSPTNNATVSGKVTVSVMPYSPDGIAWVEVFYAQGEFSTEIGFRYQSPWSFDWNTTGLSNGSYKIYAKASDNHVNVATSQNVTVTVANGPGGGTPTLTPVSIGLLAVVIALAGLGVVVLYRMRSRKNLRLPSAARIPGSG